MEWKTPTSEGTQRRANRDTALPEVAVKIVSQWVCTCRALCGTLGRWSVSNVIGVRLARVLLERREATRNLTKRKRISIA